MMVFDASAIYTCLLNNASRQIYGEHTSNLAFFEIGNIIWKSRVIFKVTSGNDARDMMSLAEKTLLNMSIIAPSLKEVYEIAERYSVSFYDAAYVQCALEFKLSLVSEDRKLVSKLGRDVSCLTVQQYLQQKVRE